MYIPTLYDSPINLTEMTDQIETQIKDGVFQIAKKYAIDIDEEKLIRILRDDRERYADAYRRGWKDAMLSIHEESATER